MCEDLRRSKRKIKETFLEMTLILTLLKIIQSYLEDISTSDAKHWDKTIKTTIYSIKKSNT